MKKEINRGDVFYAELDPIVGSEQGGYRPVLIISNAVGNKYGDTVIAAPITSQVHMKAKLPTHIVVERFDGLAKRSIILLEQIRTLDKRRLGEYVGTLDKSLLLAVNFATMISLEL